MKIRTKILLLFTVGAVVPLLLSHLFAVRMVTSSIVDGISENLSSAVEQTAGRIGDRVGRSIMELSIVVEAVPFERFPAGDLHRALEIPYRQLPGVTMVSLLDQNGRAMAPPYRKSAQEASALGRETVEDSDLALFANNVPLKLALTAEVAMGPVYLSSAGTPRMVMAKAYPLADGQTSWVLAVEVSLADICDLVAAHDNRDKRNAQLLDVQKRVICGIGDNASGDFHPHQRADRIDKIAASTVLTYVNAEGETMLGSVYEIELTGWLLLLEQPERLAMEPVQRSLYWTAIWVLVALGIALGGGAILSKELTRPIARLEEAATRIAQGDYEKSLEIQSRDEVGHLAMAFNHMTAEIRAWNVELTERVEERTRALREAREQVIQTQRLAAVGELGSGVAHEINNPLTSVIGMAQLLQSQAEPETDIAEGLEDIVVGARRVAEVVDVLLRFSQTQVSPETQSVNAGMVVEDVLNLFAARLSERTIDVRTRIEEDCRVVAVESDLRLALNHIVDNAVRAMANGGRLDVDVSLLDGGAVQITIADDGPGMPDNVRTRAFDPFFTTNPPGSGARGLGLSLVHQVVSEHDGKIVLDSVVGEGTKVTIYLTGVPRLSRD